MGRDALCSAEQATLPVAQCALEAISKNVKPGAMPVRCDVLGHWEPFRLKAGVGAPVPALSVR